MSSMKRGDVWWVTFGPAVGGEIEKHRPAVIVCNDASNKHLNRLQVVPLTSSVDHVYPSEAVTLSTGDLRSGTRAGSGDPRPTIVGTPAETRTRRSPHLDEVRNLSARSSEPPASRLRQVP